MDLFKAIFAESSSDSEMSSESDMETEQHQSMNKDYTISKQSRNSLLSSGQPKEWQDLSQIAAKPTVITPEKLSFTSEKRPDGHSMSITSSCSQSDSITPFHHQFRGRTGTDDDKQKTGATVEEDKGPRKPENSLPLTCSYGPALPPPGAVNESLHGSYSRIKVLYVLPQCRPRLQY